MFASCISQEEPMAAFERITAIALEAEHPVRLEQFSAI